MKKEKKELPKKPFACRDFIVVSPDNESITAGGLFIPDSGKDPTNPESGTVLAAGCGLVEGGKIIPLVVKAGDRVSFPRQSGTLMKDNPEWGETVFVVRENQIFWRIPKEDAG